MTPKQIIEEVFGDHIKNIKGGMTERQAVELLKLMLVDVLEFEKSKALELGVKAGRYGVLHDLEIHGADYVLQQYGREKGRVP